MHVLEIRSIHHRSPLLSLCPMFLVVWIWEKRTSHVFRSSDFDKWEPILFLSFFRLCEIRKLWKTKVPHHWFAFALSARLVFVSGMGSSMGINPHAGTMMVRKVSRQCSRGRARGRGWWAAPRRGISRCHLNRSLVSPILRQRSLALGDHCAMVVACRQDSRKGEREIQKRDLWGRFTGVREEAVGHMIYVMSPAIQRVTRAHRPTCQLPKENTNRWERWTYSSFWIRQAANLPHWGKHKNSIRGG
jgi:hypothetical protein